MMRKIDLETPKMMLEFALKQIIDKERNIDKERKKVKDKYPDLPFINYEEFERLIFQVAGVYMTKAIKFQYDQLCKDIIIEKKINLKEFRDQML